MTGVEAVGSCGETVRVNAGAVILTTGGYCMNPELTARLRAGMLTDTLAQAEALVEDIAS